MSDPSANGSVYPPFNPLGSSVRGSSVGAGVIGGFGTSGPSGSRFGPQGINSQLPIVSGTRTIGTPSTSNPVFTTGEEPIVWSLIGKNWERDRNAAFSPYGNKILSLGHHLQILEGDIGITSSHNANSDENTKHQSLHGELAKINEILAQAYFELKATMNEKGVQISDGYTRTSVSNSSTSYTHGMNHRSVLETAYNLFKESESDNPLIHLSIMDILTELKNLNENEDNETNAEDEDDDLFMDDSPGKKKPSWSSSRYPFPKNELIYKNFFQNYPEKDVYGNVLGHFVTNKAQMEHKLEIEDKDKKEIQTAMEYFEENGFNREKPLDLVYLERLFVWGLTELLATSEKYVHFMTLPGVINTWHFFGVAKSNGEGISPTLAFNGPKTEQAATIPYHVGRTARVTNRWGTHLPVGTKLFLIVKKLQFDGPYQFIPWYDTSYGQNRNAGMPALEDLQFLDEDGTSVVCGTAIYIGMVKITYKDSIPQEVRNIANGICTDRTPILFTRALQEKINIAKLGRVEIMIPSHM